ncbi:unnamed protein product [Sphenostylis stenocarpa]|uniref:RING-type domain-containing protein n=1 Tax=Sphenostylis stenocarpa TaxID=92480 RepID=A0AA87B8R7_9FABA|nr:unnamed protein product [Sphenostylis stenocarpa]
MYVILKDPTNKVSLYLEDEVAKSRNETLLLQSELDEWKNRANFAREKFQSLKRESNNQLLVLTKEKESIADAEKKACNVIHSLHESLNHLQVLDLTNSVSTFQYLIVVQAFLYHPIVNLTTTQNAVQESNAEKRKLEEHVQYLESECDNLKKVLQEEHKLAQRLAVESGKSHEAAKLAMKEVEAVRQELQEEREHSQRLRENFRRDLIFAESRAAFAEAKLSGLYKNIRMSDYKVCSICLSNDKDLAFGCGHMTCRECGTKLSRCPICRKQITNLIKLFPG